MRPLPPAMREKVLVAADLFADFGLDATKMDDSLRRVTHRRRVAAAILGAVTTVGINASTISPDRPLDQVTDVVVRGVLPGGAA